jgi:K+-transporting ATPase A subunit
LTYTFGKMIGDTRQGWAIFAAFSVMFLIGVFVCYHFEQAGNPAFGKMGIETAFEIVSQDDHFIDRPGIDGPGNDSWWLLEALKP